MKRRVEGACLITPKEKMYTSALNEHKYIGWTDQVADQASWGQTKSTSPVASSRRIEHDKHIVNCINYRLPQPVNGYMGRKLELDD